ncbi:hypothetical protein GE118_00395 [Mycoplasma sp. NEAQ87857]|uniref:hypothetical protein n=1 Tax=Mycoplasma sp. NEAQ87857 TaxID=2683967 RepID=UPI001318224D|nr:hypothetical protein [Mycoplasma sp. NEAQ87857]QGZ97263.1 hypothetical protein GE118_00395 [Mycoplasma sp. NEAQ87857]
MGASSFSVYDIHIKTPKGDKNNYHYKAGLKNVIFDCWNYWPYDEENDTYDYSENEVASDVFDLLNSEIDLNEIIATKEYLASKESIKKTEKELLKLAKTKKNLIKVLNEYREYEDKVSSLEELFDQKVEHKEWDNLQSDYNSEVRFLIQPDIDRLQEFYFDDLNNIADDLIKENNITEDKDIYEVKNKIFKPMIDDLNNQLFYDADNVYAILKATYGFNEDEVYCLNDNYAHIENKTKLEDLEEYKNYKKRKKKQK